MSERQQTQGPIREELPASVAPPDVSRRLRGVRAILMGLAVLASCIGAYLLARYLARAPQDSAEAGNLPAAYECGGLIVSAADLDLGDVWDTTEFVRELTIRNPSRSDKRIEDFATSCLCTAVEPRAVVVPAGGTATVHVHIDPNHQRSPDDVNLALRPFAVEVTPISKITRVERSGWTIHGQFRSRVTLNALIETDSTDVIVEATTAEGIPAGRAFRVRQRVAHEGGQTDTVRFFLRNAKGQSISLAMEVTSHGEIPRGTAETEGDGKQS